MSLAPGTKVGVYEVIGLIGVGGMGEVARPRHAAGPRRGARDAPRPDRVRPEPDRRALAIARQIAEAQVCVRCGAA